MLQLVDVALNGAQVSLLKNGLPNSIDVSLNFDRVTPADVDGLMVDFTYSVEYGPEVASLKITGSAYCKDTPQNITKILEEYKGTKNLPPELCANAINMVNATVGMNSIFIIRPFNLAPPFMPPPMIMAPAANRKK